MVNGELVEDEKEIRESAIDFFQNLLAPEQLLLEEPNLDLIPSLPDKIDKDGLCGKPGPEEVKAAVWSISADSMPGPDGFSSLFFQTCWDVVGTDVIDAVGSFFDGAFMPRSFTASMIVLLPKKINPATWADFRPISLCNVTNKIVSKILTLRLGPILPQVLSPNQSGFIRDRLISDNVLLAQELIHDIYRCSPSPNVALKLHMAKAYDRIQWPFLLIIMARMGFPDKWISLVSRSINSCWFSVLINGAASGFFKSTRGLRQGDPLSPSLFVIAAEYLSRSLDQFILGRKERTYTTTKYGLGISHLAYADDVIIFTQANEEALRGLVRCLSHYSAVSGQLINSAKSNFFIHEKHNEWASSVRAIGGYQQGHFPFLYLGAPIFRGIKKTDLFVFIRDKIADRIRTWSHRHLSFGGWLTLIKSTLGAIPLHIFQVLEPTKEALKQMERLISRFFWASTNVDKRTHWIKWQTCCLPQREGGLGIRRLHDMVMAFSIKLWWRFRKRDSLWAIYMHNKYCSYTSPLATSSSSRISPVWRRIQQAGADAHQFIKWSLGEGKISFWDDIWLGDRPLREQVQADANVVFRRVRDFWVNNKWDVEKLQRNLAALARQDLPIGKILDIPVDSSGRDTARWDLSGHGNFSVTSAWELIRHKEPRARIFAQIWNKNISPTISIFLWRLLSNRVPVDTKLQWRNIELASKCRCCTRPGIESVQHLFLNGDAAYMIWSSFARWFPKAQPIPRDDSRVDERLRIWLKALPHASTSHIGFIIPCLILWFIWCERNNVVHREAIFRPHQVVWMVILHLRSLVYGGNLQPEQWEGSTPQVDFMPTHPPRKRIVKSIMVLWRPPEPPWIKLNSDGAFSSASNKAGAGGVIRDHQGNLIQAFSMPTEAQSSFEAELWAVSKGISLATSLGQHLWIELDAAALVTFINSGNLGPASMRHVMVSIRNYLGKIQWKVSYIPREGNKAADFLAKRGADSQNMEVFNERSAPSMVKALIILDKQGTLNFRFQTQWRTGRT